LQNRQVFILQSKTAIYTQYLIKNIGDDSISRYEVGIAVPLSADYQYQRGIEKNAYIGFAIQVRPIGYMVNFYKDG